MQEKENKTVPLTVEMIDIDQSTILANLSGKIIDTTTSNELVSNIVEKLSPERNKVILNLEKIEYINSNGLNSLIAILTKTRTRGGEVILCNINEKVEKLLLITKLNSVFNIESSIENAQKKLTTFNKN